MKTATPAISGVAVLCKSSVRLLLFNLVYIVGFIAVRYVCAV